MEQVWEVVGAVQTERIPWATSPLSVGWERWGKGPARQRGGLPSTKAGRRVPAGLAFVVGPDTASGSVKRQAPGNVEGISFVFGQPVVGGGFAKGLDDQD